MVLRAEAYMLGGQWTRAKDQWQAILLNPGIVQLSATGPYARLQLSRTLSSTASRVGLSRARKAYQEFLRLWSDAEPDNSVFKQAQVEFERLESELKRMR
jgi:hypothetical protein